MDKVHKPSDPECYTPSSESFRIYLQLVDKPSNPECYTPSSEPFRIYLQVYFVIHFGNLSLNVLLYAFILSSTHANTLMGT
jgi:hypothetical protein